jgi:hypothetical protein
MIKLTENQLRSLNNASAQILMELESPGFFARQAIRFLGGKPGEVDPSTGRVSGDVTVGDAATGYLQRLQKSGNMFGSLFTPAGETHLQAQTRQDKQEAERKSTELSNRSKMAKLSAAYNAAHNPRHPQYNSAAAHAARGHFSNARIATNPSDRDFHHNEALKALNLHEQIKRYSMLREEDEEGDGKGDGKEDKKKRSANTMEIIGKKLSDEGQKALLTPFIANLERAARSIPGAAVSRVRLGNLYRGTGVAQ